MTRVATMSALDRELRVLRGFCSSAGDMAAVDEAEAELAAVRARAEAAERDAALLDSGCIRLISRDDYGEPIATLFTRIDLRAAIRAGIDAARGGA